MRSTVHLNFLFGKIFSSKLILDRSLDTFVGANDRSKLPKLTQVILTLEVDNRGKSSSRIVRAEVVFANLFAYAQTCGRTDTIRDLLFFTRSNWFGRLLLLLFIIIFVETPFVGSIRNTDDVDPEKYYTFLGYPS